MVRATRLRDIPRSNRHLDDGVVAAAGVRWPASAEKPAARGTEKAGR